MEYGSEEDNNRSWADNLDFNNRIRYFETRKGTRRWDFS